MTACATQEEFLKSIGTWAIGMVSCPGHSCLCAAQKEVLKRLGNFKRTADHKQQKSFSELLHQDDLQILEQCHDSMGNMVHCGLEDRIPDSLEFGEFLLK